MTSSRLDRSDEIRADLLRRRLDRAMEALRVIAEGPPKGREDDWGEWCSLWARDERSAVALIEARRPE